MNQIFFHMKNQKKINKKNMAKTSETNISSDKDEEKSNSQCFNQGNPAQKKHNYFYLFQYQKYFNKKLVIKYNILPNEYTLMKLDNFISAKYCHSLAVFKESLIYNYDEEFLNKFYTIKESTTKIPLFSEFYKSYIKFFCFPTLAELKLNDLIEEVAEKKAKAFYNENYSEKNEKNNEKKINIIIFTNKIRQDISRRNSLTNLTKTTIKNLSTNKSSVSLVTIEKIFNELNGQDKKDTKIINNSKSKTKKNNNSVSKGLKNSVILHKIKKKIKINHNNKFQDINNKSIQIKNNTTTEFNSSGKIQKIKNKISKNIQSKLSGNKTSTLSFQNLVKTQKNVSTILKINSKINFNKNMLTLLDNKKLSSNNINNSKNLIANKSKEIKNKQLINNIYKNYCNTINPKSSLKNNTLISNLSNNSNLKINITNFNLNKIHKNHDHNYIIHKTISNSNNNSNSLIKKKIKVIKKPSLQKIKKIKSRNYKCSINDNNNIFQTQIKNDFVYKNLNKENTSDYYTINNNNTNTIFKKLTNQKSKLKIKLVKTDKKNNIHNKLIVNQNSKNINSNNFITVNKQNTNNYITSNMQKESVSSSSFLNNLKDNNNRRKNRVIESKFQTQTNTKSCLLNDSQKFIKNLKVVKSRENSKNILNDYKIKINKKVNYSTDGDVKKLKQFKVIV